jgi:cyclopropane-fatty-acyl-phospholipid synthase
VGLTLSEAQAAWVRAKNLPNTEIRVESWADYVPSAKFQAAISIGAFEHFARLDFREEEKVAAYRKFFLRCHDLLEEGGVLSLQTFAYGSARPRTEATSAEATQFLAQEIFRETDPPTLANIAEAIRGTFELVRMHNDREGYAKTCRVWLETLKARKDEAIRVAGQEVYERYRKYLYFSFAGFMNRNLDLYRITLRRLPGEAK